jgi:hypothetical protein
MERHFWMHSFRFSSCGIGFYELFDGMIRMDRRRNKSYLVEYGETPPAVEVGLNFRAMWIPLSMGKQIMERSVGAGD